MSSNVRNRLKFGKVSRKDLLYTKVLKKTHFENLITGVRAGVCQILLL